MDYSRFLRAESQRRQPSAIRSLQKFMKDPEILNLGGGNPNPQGFPFAGCSVRLKDGTVLDIEGEEFACALQYSPTRGLETLVQWIRTYHEEMHRPPTAWDICVTSGSQDALAKAFDMLLDDNSSLITENPTYPGALAAIVPKGCHITPVRTDSDGMDIDALQDTLHSWDTLHPGAAKPRVVYTIPNGQNPSGITMSTERRQKLYRVAQEHDLLILEDDPYYQLVFGDRSPSLQSMDVDGRVLRFDSFSKCLAAGFRIGYISGPEPLVERVQLHMQASALHTSGISQCLLSSLLNHWGIDGFNAHVKQLCDMYRARRDKMVESVRTQLGDRVSFDVPKAGMFLWLRLKGVVDSGALVREKAVAEKVVMVPGDVFQFSSEPSPFVRVSYSVIREDLMDEAMRRLARVLDQTDSAA